MIHSPWLGFLRWLFLALVVTHAMLRRLTSWRCIIIINHLASTDNLTRRNKTEHMQMQTKRTQKGTLTNSNTLKTNIVCDAWPVRLLDLRLLSQPQGITAHWLVTKLYCLVTEAQREPGLVAFGDIWLVNGGVYFYNPGLIIIIIIIIIQGRYL